jgi:phosphohistidine phosphatase SixA
LKIYLVRHAERNERSPEKDCNQPLTLRGVKQAEELAKQLTAEGVPTLLLTSKWLHSRETTGLLAARMPPSMPVLPLEALTPFGKRIRFDLNEIIDESKQTGYDLFAHETVAMVLHHPRQTQLALMITGKDYRDWERMPKPKSAEAICLTADTLDDFVNGKGLEKTRIIPQHPT